MAHLTMADVDEAFRAAAALACPDARVAVLLAGEPASVVLGDADAALTAFADATLRDPGDARAIRVETRSETVLAAGVLGGDGPHGACLCASWHGADGLSSGAARAALAALSPIATVLLRHKRDLALLADAAATIEVQAGLIRSQETALAHSKKIFERSSAVARIGVWECALPSLELTWTDGVYDIFELPRGTPVTREQILALYDPESMKELELVRSKAIRERSAFSLDARITTARGRRRWMRITANIECENGEPVRIFGMKQDITEEKALWERTRLLAEFDVMTGLANRTLFQARLAELCAVPEPDAVDITLLLIDLDGFKQVNDTFGHTVGDECLIRIAERLNAVCPKAQLIARLGGDEFAVLMGGEFDQRHVETVADGILRALRRPIEWRDQSFQLGASIGIETSPAAPGRDPSDIFTRADIALYAAKTSGRNTFRRFVPQMKAEVDRRFETVRTVGMALSSDELDMFYQPKMVLETQTLAGFEALMRWRRGDGEVVSAASFSPAFNDPELARRLGQWTIARVLTQAQAWHRAGLRFGHVAINLNAAQLSSPRFGERLLGEIVSSGLLPGMIELEVTEGIILDDADGTVRQTLQQLKDAGVRTSLDDFGTGYASLVHLRTSPVDTIKIDRSFVQRFLTSAPDRAILESIVRLGHDLGMAVVAEGIETIAQLDRLKVLGCPLGQGFLFSKAVPADEAVRWMTRLDAARVA